MSVSSTLRGNAITEIDGIWYYLDTKKPTVGGLSERPCGRCGKLRTAEGHDACLGTLPGIINACCGHGDPDAAYLQLQDGSIVVGEKMVEVMNERSQ